MPLYASLAPPANCPLLPGLCLAPHSFITTNHAAVHGKARDARARETNGRRPARCREAHANRDDLHVDASWLFTSASAAASGQSEYDHVTGRLSHVDEGVSTLCDTCDHELLARPQQHLALLREATRTEIRKMTPVLGSVNCLAASRLVVLEMKAVHFTSGRIAPLLLVLVLRSRL